MFFQPIRQPIRVKEWATDTRHAGVRKIGVGKCGRLHSRQCAAAWVTICYLLTNPGCRTTYRKVWKRPKGSSLKLLFELPSEEAFSKEIFCGWGSIEDSSNDHSSPKLNCSNDHISTKLVLLTNIGIMLNVFVRWNLIMPCSNTWLQCLLVFVFNLIFSPFLISISKEGPTFLKSSLTPLSRVNYRSNEH